MLWKPMGSRMTETTLTQQVNSVLATLTEDIKNNKLELPSPPDLLLKVRALIADEQTSANDIAELVKQDPHIAARLIKVANCALFGARKHVNSVKSAVARLGLPRVQNLVIGLSIAQNLMKTKTQGLEVFFNHSWQQSNSVAATSYVLALHKTNIDPEQALLAGMIHNIGTLPLVLRLSHIEALKNNPKVLAMVADVVVPKLYPKAGQLVMKSWNFPSDIINIARSHCDLNRDAGDAISLDDIVLIAHQLNQQNDFTDVDNHPSTLLKSSIFKLFWADQEQAKEELKSFQEEINQMKEDLSH